MQMIRAKCGRCSWEFDLVAIPGPALDVSLAMKARSVCPLCYSGQTFLANSRPLTDAERQAFKPSIFEVDGRPAAPSSEPTEAKS